MVVHLTKVTRKGQITVPIEIRRALGLAEGDSVAVTLEGGRVTLERRASIVERTAGICSSDAPPLAPGEEQAAFEEGVAKDVAARLID